MITYAIRDNPGIVNPGNHVIKPGGYQLLSHERDAIFSWLKSAGILTKEGRRFSLGTVSLDDALADIPFSEGAG